ncbi:Surfactant protein B, partial [Trichostrongylus colubriformis]
SWQRPQWLAGCVPDLQDRDRGLLPANESASSFTIGEAWFIWMRGLSVLLLAIAATVAIGISVNSGKSPSELVSIECEMCEMAVRTVVPMMDQDTKDIENAVNNECKELLHKIPFATHKCQKFVDEDLNKIIKELESGTAPKDVCTKIGMC